MGSVARCTRNSFVKRMSTEEQHLKQGNNLAMKSERTEEEKGKCVNNKREQAFAFT